MPVNRRELLAGSAALALTAAWRSPLRAASARAIPIGRAGGPPSDAPRADEVEATVRWVMTTPRDAALSRAAREVHAGLDPSLLLGAVLVAAARDIRTDRASFNHAALLVSAIDQLAEGSPSPERSRDMAPERSRDVLWCLDNFKETQEREANSDDWRMTPIERAKLPDGARARTALIDALERWDREAADVALVGWIRSAPLDEVYALVWEYGLRCVANLGHKAIYACYSRRALPLAGERFAEDVLRSVVSSFFLDGPTHRSAPFEKSRELTARRVEARTARPAAGAGPERELLSAIRAHAPEDLPAIVAHLVDRGAPHAALWDAVLAAASEIAVADPAVAPLHACTSMNSLHTIARRSPSARVAELALFQAAAWMAEFRASLGAEARAVRTDALEREERSLNGILADEKRGVRTARGALHLAAHDAGGFLAHAHELARDKSDDVHEFKLAAAVLEEAHAAGTWARPFACAALAVHLPSPERADGTRIERIRDAMAVASTH